MHYLIFVFVAFVMNVNLCAAPIFSTQSAREKKAVNTILSSCHKCGLKESEIKKVVHFIEKDFSKFIAQKQYHLGTHVTGLPFAVEYDVETDLYFIHLDQFLGKGRVKIVNRSIQYSLDHPKIVATTTIRARGSLNSEITVLKNLQHCDRILHLIATPKNENGDFHKMMTTFYAGGALSEIENIKNLTLREKISLAKDLMEALKEAHERGFVHEDIHSANIILERNKNSALQNIRYRLVLIDWGKAIAVSGPHEYYKRKDVYAAGVTLYGLLHNLHHPKHLYYKLNKFSSLFNENRLSKNPNKLLLGELSERLTDKMAMLDKQYKAGTLKSREKFERLILHMMHPKTVDSRDAQYWYDQFNELLS